METLLTTNILRSIHVKSYFLPLLLVSEPAFALPVILIMYDRVFKRLILPKLADKQMHAFSM